MFRERQIDGVGFLVLKERISRQLSKGLIGQGFLECCLCVLDLRASAKPVQKDALFHKGLHRNGVWHAAQRHRRTTGNIVWLLWFFFKKKKKKNDTFLPFFFLYYYLMHRKCGLSSNVKTWRLCVSRRACRLHLRPDLLLFISVQFCLLLLLSLIGSLAAAFFCSSPGLNPRIGMCWVGGVVLRVQNGWSRAPCAKWVESCSVCGSTLDKVAPLV